MASGQDLLKGSSIHITGGTGSFGRAFGARVLEQYPDVRRCLCRRRA